VDVTVDTHLVSMDVTVGSGIKPLPSLKLLIAQPCGDLKTFPYSPEVNIINN
jgi:hypothetical protein